jgi:hypothetical protein
MEERTRQSRPTTPDDLHRLLAVAKGRGLMLTQAEPGVWFCSSASAPEAPHYVTGVSCDCRGFVEHQRCTHLALLLAHLGWLPPLASATEPCVACSGCGVRTFRTFDEPCATCHGTGEVLPDVALAA